MDLNIRRQTYKPNSIGVEVVQNNKTKHT